MSTSRSDLLDVRPGLPCLICGMPIGCKIRLEGDAIICMRVETGSRSASKSHPPGWVHAVQAERLVQAACRPTPPAGERPGDFPATPKMLPVYLGGIPAELRDCPQWVLWTSERRPTPAKDGRIQWSKTPKRFDTRANASPTDPATWCRYESLACYYEKKRDTWPGIGFNFSEEDPYCGVDLDDCRNPDTGEITAWAQDSIRRLNSYAEVSPSGTGVKLFCRGEVAGGRHRAKVEAGEIEVYSSARFFAVTGIHVAGTPTTVNDAQDELDAICAEYLPQVGGGVRPPVVEPRHLRSQLLSDVELIAAMERAVNGPRFAALYRGDVSAHGGDRSRSDLAFANLLMFACGGDLRRADAIFRQSGLMRPKWDEKRGDRTYGERTLAAALRSWDGVTFDPNYRSEIPDGVLRHAGFKVERRSKESEGEAESADAPATPTPTVEVAAGASVGGGETSTGGGGATGSTTPQAAPGVYRLSNYVTIEQIIEGVTTYLQRGISFPHIAEALLREAGRRLRIPPGQWPCRVGDRLFVPSFSPNADEADGVTWLGSANDLFGWVSDALAPHSAEQGNSLDWMVRGNDMLSKEQFFSRMCHSLLVPQFEDIQLFPHEKPLERMYYPRFPDHGGCGAALAEFLDFWTPGSEADRSLMQAALLTLVWGGLPGARPAFAIDSDAADPEGGTGVGKTTFCQQAAALVGGALSVDRDEEFAELNRRLLSAEGRRLRVCLLDNVKSLRLSNDNLEALICRSEVSGRQMYTGEGRRPNYNTVLVTFNGARFSRDMARRVVTIVLRQPEHRPGDWLSRLADLVKTRRWELIGDLLACLRSPVATPLTPRSRWAQWEVEVLARCPHAEAAQRLFIERQESTNADDESSDGFRELVETALLAEAKDPATACVFFTTDQLHALWRRFTRSKKVDRNHVRAAILGLRLREIPEPDRRGTGGERGLMWRGTGAPVNSKPRIFEPSHPSNFWLMDEDGTQSNRRRNQDLEDI